MGLNDSSKQLYCFILQNITPALLSALWRGCSVVSCLSFLEICVHICVTNFPHCITAMRRMTGAEWKVWIKQIFWWFLISCGYLFCELCLGCLPRCVACYKPWAKTSTRGYSMEKGRCIVPLLKFFFSHSYLLPVNSDMYRQMPERLSIINNIK